MPQPPESKYLDALRTVIDPELRFDVVSLGFIYNIQIDEDKLCTVDMTLTIMGCPLSNFLYEQIRAALVVFDEIVEVKVNLVWEPAWSRDNLSPEIKMQLGIY
ncbi:metal-sulfur cluster assembly factor [Eupransor demetentiae]|uniref:Metal-sulfur cluster biosynthetic enzyme (PaaD) n=1 Tax=Eupransor demetentiae TaxID=3109584 RepID=A0ABP0EQJ1_9LACO|nr:Metal-sulfur cluster biosynthetic enzyme (PaaD) [Lactobacillaceae bacterium LMG 33000]